MNQTMLFPLAVDGLCGAIPSGVVIVQFLIGPCLYYPDSVASGDARTG